ncbi:MAG: lytic transglycosylase domain-containing protein [Candidatus Pacebacteria bacterium]|nr:lytic transglycosylase domain-containing protein [Candidatus Paceibacterota bacterium]
MQAAPKVIEKYRYLIEVNSARYDNFPTPIVAAIILTESGGRERARGGLTQLNPANLKYSHRHCSVRHADCAIEGTIAYLHWLNQYEGGDMRRTIVAYNLGPKGAQNVDLDKSPYLAKVESILPTTTAIMTPL